MTGDETSQRPGARSAGRKRSAGSRRALQAPSRDSRTCRATSTLPEASRRAVTRHSSPSRAWGAVPCQCSGSASAGRKRCPGGDAAAPAPGARADLQGDFDTPAGERLRRDANLARISSRRFLGASGSRTPGRGRDERQRRARPPAHTKPARPQRRHRAEPGYAALPAPPLQRRRAAPSARTT